MSMNLEYHKQANIKDFIVGKTRNGVIMVKKYTMLKGEGYHSDYPLYEFPVETIGM